jgi:hypothetical protein
VLFSAILQSGTANTIWLLSLLIFVIFYFKNNSANNQIPVRIFAIFLTAGPFLTVIAGAIFLLFFQALFNNEFLSLQTIIESLFSLFARAHLYGGLAALITGVYATWSFYKHQSIYLVRLLLVSIAAAPVTILVISLNRGFIIEWAASLGIILAHLIATDLCWWLCQRMIRKIRL